MMERSIKDTVASSVKPSRQERPVPPEVLSLLLPTYFKALLLL